MDHEEYIRRVKSHIKTPIPQIEEQLAEFVKKCSYLSGQYNEDAPFQKLEEKLEELEKGRKENNRIFYMALPPSVFADVAYHLKKNCYPKNGIVRVIVHCYC